MVFAVKIIGFIAFCLIIMFVVGIIGVFTFNTILDEIKDIKGKIKGNKNLKEEDDELHKCDTYHIYYSENSNDDC